VRLALLSRARCRVPRRSFSLVYGRLSPLRPRHTVEAVDVRTSPDRPNPVQTSSFPAHERKHKVEDNPNPLMYFLNHVLNYFMYLVNYCCNIDAIWRFMCMILEIRYIRVTKIKPRDNTLNMRMIL
jgi:hypothetical protein